MSKILKLFTDGGSRGNPGPAAIGGVLYDAHDQIVAEFSRYIGETTNNQAEYQALVFGLQQAAELGAKEVACYLDSELVVKQLKKEYRVKDPAIAEQFIKVWNGSQVFDKVTFTHVRREKNKAADALVNLALDRRLDNRKS